MEAVGIASCLDVRADVDYVSADGGHGHGEVFLKIWGRGGRTDETWPRWNAMTTSHAISRLFMMAVPAVVVLVQRHGLPAGIYQRKLHRSNHCKLGVIPGKSVGHDQWDKCTHQQDTIISLRVRVG